MDVLTVHINEIVELVQTVHFLEDIELDESSFREILQTKIDNKLKSVGEYSLDDTEINAAMKEAVDLSLERKLSDLSELGVIQARINSKGEFTYRTVREGALQPDTSHN